MDWSNIFKYENGVLIRLSTGKPTGSNQGKYLQTTSKRKSFYVHRVIWEMHNGKIPEGMQVDHINGDPLDNRIENLRLATQQQNNWNLPRKNYHKRGNKYRVQICIGDRQYSYGSYYDVELAELVANEVCVKHQGEFHRSLL